MINVGVFGGNGRVAKFLIHLLAQDEDSKLASLYVRNELNFSIEAGTLVTNDLKVFLSASDLVIDFSHHEGTLELLKATLNDPKPLVIGTTGLSNEAREMLKEVGKLAPVLHASNMSYGVAVLNKLVASCSSMLPDADVSIIEVHHKAKKDAPSGTALELAHLIKSTNPSTHSIRAGDVVGVHSVSFYLNGECVELKHTASNREIFARGALNAAKWLLRKKPGLYSISDIN